MGNTQCMLYDDSALPLLWYFVHLPFTVMVVINKCYEWYGIFIALLAPLRHVYPVPFKAALVLIRNSTKYAIRQDPYRASTSPSDRRGVYKCWLASDIHAVLSDIDGTLPASLSTIIVFYRCPFGSTTHVHF